MLKAGLNFQDVNRAKKLLEAGYSHKEIARDVRCTVDVIDRRFGESAEVAAEPDVATDETPEPEVAKKKTSKKKTSKG